MTILQKTVEYPIGINTATLAAATRYDFSAVSLYLPETTSRTFRSVYAKISFNDAQAATASRASLSSFLTGIKLGAVAFSDTTITTTLTDSGEQTSYMVFSPEWAAYFNSNFGTGTSQTCQVGFQFATSSTTNPVILQNISVTLVITYDYDDSATTRVKTLRIPLESNTGALTTTLASVGSSQIPALDTYLEEASKVYRAIWFEIEGNESNTGTTTYSYCAALDSEAEVQFGGVIQACQSSSWHRYIWARSELATNVTHDYKHRISAGSATHNHLTVTLCVTYTYSETDSTRIMNQVRLPFADPYFIWGTTSASISRWAWKLWLSEPGTLSLKQSSVFLQWGISAVANPVVKMGSQTARTYTAAMGTVSCGAYCLQQRIDAGSSVGAGVTLGNAGTATDLTFDLYAATSARLSGVGGYVLLTWSSDKSAGGSGRHLQTVRKLMQGSVATATSSTLSASVVDLPEASPFVVAVGLLGHRVGTLSAFTYELAAAEIASGEGTGDGYATYLAQSQVNGGELGYATSWGDSTNGLTTQPVSYPWKRWPNDPAACLDPEASRNWRLQRATTAVFALESWTTYSSMLFNTDRDVGGGSYVAAAVTGSAGGTVTIGLHDASTGELLQSTTRTGDGAYTLTWGDARPCFTEARENGTHLARSDTGSLRRAA